MFTDGQKVRCTDTEMVGFIDDKEWENGWHYTIQKEDGLYFYRTEDELTPE